MRSAIALLAMMVLVVMVPATSAQQTVQPPQPFPSWGGSFIVSNSVAFVWLREAPLAGSPILGTYFPAQRMDAVEPPAGSGLVFEPAHNQWWGYVTTGIQEGWIEIALLTRIERPDMFQVNNPRTWMVTDTETVEVRVRAGVPFVWPRTEANPGSGIVNTIFPGALLTVTGYPSVDQFNQTWWPIRINATRQLGYVEETSLEFVRVVPLPSPTAGDGPFAQGDVVRLTTVVPFAWFRADPRSDGRIIGIIGNLEMRVVNGPVSDGVQNWWYVQRLGSTAAGWIEERSLTFVR